MRKNGHTHKINSDERKRLHKDEKTCVKVRGAIRGGKMRLTFFGREVGIDVGQRGPQTPLVHKRQQSHAFKEETEAHR